MLFNNYEEIRAFGFEGFKTVRELRKDSSCILDVINLINYICKKNMILLSIDLNQWVFYFEKPKVNELLLIIESY
jgi:hypothetical protein